MLIKSKPYFRPHQYQKAAIDLVINAGCLGIILDPGMGKTTIALCAIDHLVKKGVVRKILIIAPKSVCYGVWPAEIKKWSNLQHLEYSILHGPKKDAAFEQHSTINIMNPEGLSWLSKKDLSEFDMVICDESTMFKHTSSGRSKTLRKLLPKFTRRVIMTGTFAPNGLINVFGQIYILDQGRSLGKYITRFRDEYFYPSGYGGYTWKLQQGADERIYSAIDHLIFHLSANDYLELPEKIITTRYIELPKKSREVYKQLKDDLISMLDDPTNPLIASNAAVATSKCRQLANGWVYRTGDNGVRDAVDLHDGKIEELKSLVNELEGQPLLIGYEFQHDLVRIKKALGDVPHIGKGTRDLEVAGIVEKWNMGEIPVLLGSIPSMSFGLNLQGGGNHILFFNLPWELDKYTQFLARIWRQGQTKPVHVYQFVARGTIEEAVIKTLSSKDKTQSALMSALRTNLQ